MMTTQAEETGLNQLLKWFDAVTDFIGHQDPAAFNGVNITEASRELEWLAQLQEQGTTERQPYYRPTQGDSS